MAEVTRSLEKTTPSKSLSQLEDPKLTHNPSKAVRSFFFWHLDDEKVEGQAGEGNANANEGADGVTVKWNSHQEDGTEAEDHREEKAELRAQETTRS